MKGRKWLWGGLAGLGVILLAGGVWLVRASSASDYQRAAGLLPAQMAEAKKLGLPLVAEELMVGREVADAENAALLYGEIEKARREIKPQIDVMKGLMSPKPNEVKMARAEFARIRPYLHQVEQAARRPGFYVPRRWHTGSVLLTFPEYGEGKTAVGVLGLQAVMDAVEGRGDEAARRIERAAVISGHIGSEPAIISLLVRLATDSLISSNTQLAAGSLKSAADLRKLRHAFDKAIPPIRVMDNLESEVLAEIYMADSASGGSYAELQAATYTEGTPPPVPPRKAKVREKTSAALLSQAYRARTLEYWNEIYRLGEDRFDNEKLAVVVSKREALLAKTDDASYEASLIVRETQGLLFPLVKNREALKRVTLAFIDVLIFKAENGRLPASLKEAGADQFRDPFRPDSPLQYKVSGSGKFKIWSIGKDGVDDGGAAKTSEEKARDVVVSYPIPKTTLTPEVLKRIEDMKVSGAAPSTVSLK